MPDGERQKVVAAEERKRRRISLDTSASGSRDKRMEARRVVVLIRGKRGTDFTFIRE